MMPRVFVIRKRVVPFPGLKKAAVSDGNEPGLVSVGMGMRRGERTFCALAERCS